MRKLIGRKEEITVLERALSSDRPELIVVSGRRRVGKTFLIREVYKDYIQFEFSGIHNVSFRDQLKNFHFELSLRFHGLLDYISKRILTYSISLLTFFHFLFPIYFPG